MPPTIGRLEECSQFERVPINPGNYDLACPLHYLQLEDLIEKSGFEGFRLSELHLNRWDYADFRMFAGDLGRLKFWEKGPEVASMGKICEDIEVFVYQDMTKHRVYAKIRNSKGSHILHITMIPRG